MNGTHTILLVDHSENDLILMRAAFKQAGVTNLLREVCSGDEAIRYLEGKGVYSNRIQYPLPAVMLLDLNMPQKHGSEVLSWVRAQPVLKRICIFVLTASLREEDVEQAYDLGASGFLVKPGSLKVLIQMIRCLRAWMEINHFPTPPEVGRVPLQHRR